MLPEASRDGYKFDGWWTEREGGFEITTLTTVALGYETLYAHWVDESAPVLPQ